MKARADRDALGEIARELMVTRKSVNEWKRAWRVGGTWELASRGWAGLRVGWTMCSLRPWARRCTRGRPRTAGSRTSAGPWPGSPCRFSRCCG
jgi:hypothetical protein